MSTSVIGKKRFWVAIAGLLGGLAALASSIGGSVEGGITFGQFITDNWKTFVVILTALYGMFSASGAAKLENLVKTSMLGK